MKVQTQIFLKLKKIARAVGRGQFVVFENLRVLIYSIGGPGSKCEELLLFLKIFMQIFSETNVNVTYSPSTSTITQRSSLVTRNVTFTLQHMVVLCQNGLNLQRFVWEKTVIDIVAEILIFLQ